jgi:hypothetical protein
VVILDLRLLVFWPDAPLAVISRPTTRMAAAGFAIAAAGLLDQGDGIYWQSVSLHQNSGHWTGPAQRVPRSPLIRLARAQEPRLDLYGAPTPRRHGRDLVVLLANLNRGRPYDRLLVSSAATGERSLPKAKCLFDGNFFVVCHLPKVGLGSGIADKVRIYVGQVLRGRNALGPPDGSADQDRVHHQLQNGESAP